LSGLNNNDFDKDTDKSQIVVLNRKQAWIWNAFAKGTRRNGTFDFRDGMPVDIFHAVDIFYSMDP